MIALLSSTGTHREQPLGPRTNFKFTLTALGFILLLVACQIGEQVLIELVGKNRARSLLCSHGHLSRFGMQRERSLCAVETQLNFSSFRDAFVEQDDAALDEVVEEDSSVEPPSGLNNVAFVVTIPSCDDDSFGSAFYDAAAVLRHSVCNCTSTNPLSGSQYSNTLYAFVHPNATQCWGPTDSKDDNNLTAYKYNRIEVLEELGYWVKIWGPPIHAGQLTSEEKKNDTDFKDLLSLRAYELTSHDVVVMMKFDTIFMENIDPVINKLKSDENLKGIYTKGGMSKVNSGALLIKPDEAEFNTIIESFKNTNYNTVEGWDGSGNMGLDTEGILTYHYSRHASNYLDDTSTMERTQSIQSFRSEPKCKQPWNCFHGSDWTQAMIDRCRSLNHNWYMFRQDFEQNFWNKKVGVDKSVSKYHPDFFLGYCDGDGHYQRFADHGLNSTKGMKSMKSMKKPADTTPSFILKRGLEKHATWKIRLPSGKYTTHNIHHLIEPSRIYYFSNKDKDVDIELNFDGEQFITGAYFNAWHRTTFDSVQVGVRGADSSDEWKWFNFTQESFNLVKHNVKCPYGSKTRLFRTTESLAQCHKRCYTNETCHYFSSSKKNVCIGCTKDAVFESHKGISTFELSGKKTKFTMGSNDEGEVSIPPVLARFVKYRFRGAKGNYKHHWGLRQIEMIGFVPEWGLENQASIVATLPDGQDWGYIAEPTKMLTEEFTEFYVPRTRPDVDIDLDFGREQTVSGAYFKAWYKTKIGSIQVGVAPDDGATYTNPPLLPDDESSWTWYDFQNITGAYNSFRSITIPHIPTRYVKYRFRDAQSSFSNNWGLRQIQIMGDVAAKETIPEWGLENKAELGVRLPNGEIMKNPSMGLARLTHQKSDYYVHNMFPDVDVDLDFGKEAIISSVYVQVWAWSYFDSIQLGIAPDDGAALKKPASLPFTNSSNGWKWYDFDNITGGTYNDREVFIPNVHTRYVKYRFRGGQSWKGQWAIRSVQVKGYFPTSPK